LRLNHQKVAAELGDVLLDLLGGAGADGDHGDDGGNADDDAQKRQEGAQRVAAHGAQRQPDRLEQHQAASTRAESEAILPSRKEMVRSA
jgi:hypothetical protein